MTKVTNQPTAFMQSTTPRSILVVTVTKVEAQAVLKVFLGKNTKKWQRRIIGNKTYYDLGVHSNMPVFMVQSEMGTATPGGALLTVRQAILDLRPQAVIMCGIAFGLRPDKQQLGDILIAKQLLYYEPQKVDLQRGQIPRGDRVTASECLLDRFRSGDNDWQGAPTHFGLVLSGEKLVNDSALRDWFLKIEPEAIGGEMEGAGLYVAARDAKVDWILVKAICDWADGSKNNDAQSLVAHNAAQFVLHVLQIGGWSGSEHSKPADTELPRKPNTRLEQLLPKRDLLLRILKIAIAYFAVGWGIIWVVDLVFPALGLPDWIVKLVITLVAIGFPLSLVLVWSGAKQPISTSKSKPKSEKHNLPALLNPLIGRELELVSIQNSLSTSRLVTITGVGGVGKTHLAIEVGWRQVERWQNGVWFFRLDPLAHGGLVVSTLCRKFGIEVARQTDEVQALTEYLKKNKALLILDNCEHLAEACAPLVQEILEYCENVKIVLTSREPLGIPGEKVITLSGLDVPDTEIGELPDLLGFPSIKLFVERAKLSSNKLTKDMDSVITIATICRHVDGIPLAIELVAARVGTMSIKEIASNLKLLLSTVPNRHVGLGRHQTLWNCLDWSYELLSDSEQRLFMCIASFWGSAPFEAIGVVSGIGGDDNSELLTTIERLVHHSLIIVEDIQGCSRYRMLETVREYALTRLASNEAYSQTVKKKHATWYAELAEKNEWKVYGSSASSALNILDLEIGNLRAAAEFYLGIKNYQELSRFTALYWSWFLRGHWTEVSKLIGELISKSYQFSPPQAARVFLAAGTMQWASGNLDEADQNLLKAESIYREAALVLGLAQSLHIRGHVLHQRGKLQESLKVYEDSIILWRREGTSYWIALLLNDVGAVCSDLGIQDQAKAALDEALAISKEINDLHGQGNAMMHLGVLLRRDGKYDEAHSTLLKAIEVLRNLKYYRGLATALKHYADLEVCRGDLQKALRLLDESLTIQVQIDHRAGISRSLESLALVELHRGHAANAAYFLGSADRMRHETYTILAGVRHQELEMIEKRCMDILGKQEFLKLWSGGREADKEQVVARAFGITARSRISLSTRSFKRFARS